MSTHYVKRVCGAPPGATAWEAAGLAWLAEAEPEGGARVVEVLDVTEDTLTLERLEPKAPTQADVEELGRALARTHDAGAAAFGAGPPTWSGDGYLGPADELLPLPLAPSPTWGAFYGESRVRHTLSIARDRALWSGAGVFDRVIDRLGNGDFDDDPQPARLHGDLWTGNVVWTRGGGVLIDPAAHGGHRLTDLAMLLLFGGTREERVLAAYQEVGRLPDGWRDLIGLHQLHPLMMHAVLFGGGYVQQAESVARRYA
ncbi:MAG: fructosamine kinase family protein [Dermatophilaceae bacterium]|nr:fructosamine kinase family protein [Intrasporangiaceae bacterium]